MQSPAASLVLMIFDSEYLLDRVNTAAPLLHESRKKTVAFGLLHFDSGQANGPQDLSLRKLMILMN